MIEELQRLISHETAFTRAYGFVVTAAGDGRCSLSIPYSPQFDRPDGIVSGPVMMLAADVAMWLAVKTIRGLEDNSVTTHMETHFLQSAKQQAIVCTAEVLKSGRRRSFGSVRCVSEAGDLLSYHTVTYVSR